MYPLLIVREEIVCLVILLFLVGIARYYKMGKDTSTFFRLSRYALLHVVFDIITVITVNHLEEVPGWVNWGAHIIFYMAAILFACSFFSYTAQLCVSQKVFKGMRIVAVAAPFVYLAALPFLPIDYLTGSGTNYSFGPAVFAGYGIAMSYFLASAVLVAVRFRKLEVHVKLALLPMMAVLILAEVLQIIVPELLFTGGAVTIITIGFFFSLENPAYVFRRKLIIDALTGVESRHSYDEDIDEIERRYARDPSFAVSIAFCDINDLRNVNNTYGHLEGDAYISAVAQILMRELRSAVKIYRMGGDEFLAIFENKPEMTVREEIAAVHEACRLESGKHSYPVGVSVGFASLGDAYKTVTEALKAADYLMYENKVEMKRVNSMVVLDGKEQLNLSGLSDRITDALISMGDTSFHYVCNMETTVARVSPALAEQFELPGEFMVRFDSEWRKLIHPDDREIFDESVGSVLIRKSDTHRAVYRVLNRRGEYVTCSCRAAVLPGENGAADLLVGVIETQA